MSADERFDTLLLAIAQQTRGLDDLLDVYFSFLRRKTDAFDPPGGLAQLESTFLGVIRRQYEIAQEEKKAKAAKAAKPKAAAPKAAASSAPATAAASAASKPTAAPAVAPAPPAAATVADDVIELGAGGSFDLSAVPEKKPRVDAAAKPESDAPASASVSASASASSPAAASAAAAATDDAAAPAAGSAAADGDAADDAGEKGDKPVGNGARTDKYTWTQTLSDVTITAKLPAALRTRDVSVEIKNARIRASWKGAAAPMLDAPLHKRVKADDCTWTLDEDGGGKTLTIFLTKENDMEWWSCVAAGEPQIDITKIEPENSKLSSLDGETRRTVEKMMFDQQQRMAGKPTSDELRKQEMLSAFMKAHPEMDFSQAKMM